MNIGVIGFGKMAEAMIGRALASGTVKKKQIVVLTHKKSRDKSLKKKYGITLVDDMATLSRLSSLLFIAVKPQQMPPVLESLKPHFSNQLIMTVAAGLNVASYQKILGKNARVIRVMPNTPAMVGQGVFTVFAPRAVKSRDLKLCQNLLDPCGKTYFLKSESQMHVTSALAGSGPAFVVAFADALIQAVLPLGLNEKLARDLFLNTILGTVTLMQKSKLKAHELIAQVASKKGMTEAGLSVLDKNRFTQLLGECIQEAVKRSHELGGIKK